MKKIQENKKKQKSGNLSWYKYILIIIGIFLFIFIIKKIFFEKNEENKNGGLQIRPLDCELEEKFDEKTGKNKWFIPEDIVNKIKWNKKVKMFMEKYERP
jgi:hypothetical protein